MRDAKEEAIIGIAHEILIRASIDIDHQLAAGAETQPIAVMLVRAREEAVAAVPMLIECDPTDATQIRALQDKVRRFSDLIRWLSDIVKEGMWLKARVDEDQREHLVALLQPDDDSEYSNPEEFDDADAEQG